MRITAKRTLDAPNKICFRNGAGRRPKAAALRHDDHSSSGKIDTMQQGHCHSNGGGKMSSQGNNRPAPKKSGDRDGAKRRGEAPWGGARHTQAQRSGSARGVGAGHQTSQRGHKPQRHRCPCHAGRARREKLPRATAATTAPTTGELATSHTITGRAAACAYVALGAAATE